MILVVFTSAMSSQTLNTEVEDVTRINKFTVKSDAGIFNYSVKVDSKATDVVNTVNNNKKERARIDNGKYVVTTITVKNNVDEAYDNLITLSYNEKELKPVQIMPTTTGFDILVHGERLQYNFIKQVCISPDECPVEVKLASADQ